MIQIWWLVALSWASSSVCQLEPKYVFHLPGANKTLIYRKRDFLAAIYPNVTSVYKIKKKKKDKDLQISDSIINESFRKISDLNDNYDKIVEENVRTEKNFIDFINSMNDDLKSSSSVASSEEAVKPNSWADLGLDGWSGSLAKNAPKLKR